MLDGHYRKDRAVGIIVSDLSLFHVELAAIQCIEECCPDEEVNLIG